MSANVSTCAAEIVRRGGVGAADVARLRLLLPSVCPCEETAALLFSVHEACHLQDTAWRAFFIDAIADYVVAGREPAGYLDVPNAIWLARKIGPGGLIRTRVEFDLLVTVLERARWSPAALARFALEQVEFAVRTGSGPLRQGGGVQGEICEHDVALVRRILCAFAQSEGRPITRPEAEALLLIDEAASAGTRNEAWTDLLVKALTNALMASSGYAPPPREEALRAEPWLRLRTAPWPCGNGFQDVPPRAFDALATRYAPRAPEDGALAELDRQRIAMVTNEKGAEADAGWLAGVFKGAAPAAKAWSQGLLHALRAQNARLHPLLSDVAEAREAA